MNHVTQLNRLLELEKKYKNFLPFCPPEKVTALTLELHKIDLRIRKINGMNLEQSIAEVTYWFDTKQSKMNFLYN
jgi:hypothetical protein